MSTTIRNDAGMMHHTQMKGLTDYMQERINEGLKITKDTEIDDLYNEEGVYAYFKDKTLSSDEDYIKYHKDDAIGVAVIYKLKEGDDSPSKDIYHRIVILKDVASFRSKYGGWNINLSTCGASLTDRRSEAIHDFNGKKNTEAIEKACHGKNDGFKMGSLAGACMNEYDGAYLPALGELMAIFSYLNEVNEMMSMIGGTKLTTTKGPSRWYWSSTLRDDEYSAWLLDMGSPVLLGDVTFTIRKETYSAIPIIMI